MKDSIKEKIIKIFTVSIVIVTLIFGLSFAWPYYQLSQAVKQKQRGLDIQISETKAEIEALKVKQMRFKKDRDFIEAIARQNGRVFPGELVFIFKEE